MALAIENEVLLVSIDDPVGPNLKHASADRGWTFVRCPSLPAAMKQVVKTRPRVVVLQVSQSTDRALRLIRMLQTSWRRTPLIVAAGDHSEQFERQVRIAGATHYLAQGDSPEMVDRCVDSVLEPAVEHESAVVATADDLHEARFKQQTSKKRDRFSDPQDDVFERRAM